MSIQTHSRSMSGARALSIRPFFSLLAITTLAALFSACSPIQQGADQVKDVNVNLVELKDAKYKTLPVAEGGLSAQTRANIDEAVNEFMESKEVPIAGCAIAITRNNQIAYLQGYGFAELATSRPFTIATPSAIGSISKTLTVLGLLTLVEEGKINLDESLLDQMQLTPGVDVAWTGDPTVREVLAHKGGFISGAQPVWDAAVFTDGPSIMAAFPNMPFPSLQPLFVFQGYKTQAGNQAPAQIGTIKYSNVGYSVAGSLLDYYSKQPGVPAELWGYEKYLWRRVARGSSAVEPTMITAALATDFRAGDIKNFAHGYDKDGSSLTFGDSDSVGWGWEGPAGGWSMTIGDLARLMLIMQSNAVVNKATIDNEMRQSYGQLFNDGTRVGLGLELASNGSWFGKGGDILGYTADYKIWPQQTGTNWGVAFLCNQKGTGKQLTSLLHNILTSQAGNVAGAGQEQEIQAPLVQLANQYEPLARQFAQRYLSQGGKPEEAWRRAKQELLRYPNGSKLASLLERGELESALKLLPSVMPAN